MVFGYATRLSYSARSIAIKTRLCPASVRFSSASIPARQWSTPLAKNLAEVINTTGPISIAAYMRQCLTSPDGGYYTSRAKGADQFGQKGDFITSPEISQVFGELLGIWLVTEWMAQGKRSSGIEIIEVGPGRGTLMDDILRTVRNFKSLASGIESIYLVEASPALRDAQRRLLCDDATLAEVENGFMSHSKYGGIPIIWYEDIRFVPNDHSKTPFIFAHEFFDALPIHAFQSVAPSPTSASTINGLDGPITVTNPSPTSKTPQWRELVVTPTPPTSNITAISRPSLPTQDQPPDFQLSVTKASTPSSLVLPEISARYKALKHTPGSVIEICPELHSYAAEFARRIGGTTATSSAPSQSTKSIPSGAALILDYGPSSTVPVSTLRGIRAHKLVSPFSSPGLVDISADVDFTALAQAAIQSSPGVEVHGPTEQGGWLERMGIWERSKAISENFKGKDSEGTKRIAAAVERLVERGGGGMGKLYKVMAIVPENGGRRQPVGFSGGVGKTS